jgi:inosine/xanthosine triphosphatase
MPHIVIASHNPVKILAARRAFERLYPALQWSSEGVSVPSGVDHQPFGSAETRQGALNRARAAAQAQPAADFWVGIEGGVEEDGDQLAAFAWVAVLSAAQVGLSRSGTFYLPPAVTALVRAGKELGEADDIVFRRNNSKQEQGAVGLLSGGVIDRAGLYEHAAILALLPFKNPDLYGGKINHE